MKTKLIILTAIVSLVIVIYVSFLSRPPVLIITDVSFIPLYGEDRARIESTIASIQLLRPVKAVMIADDVGADIVQYAVSDASLKPYCVIFPLRFAEAARIYKGSNPGVPVVILEGRYTENANPASFALESGSNNDYFLFRTDISADFYLAAQAAIAIDDGKNGRVAVFTEPAISSIAREAVLSVINEMENPLITTFYTSFTQYSQNSETSCIIIAGTGNEFLENRSTVPVILFSWLDPQLMPFNVVLMLNDSPFAQVTEIVKMAAARHYYGRIRSKPVVLQGADIEKEILQKIKKIR